MVAILITGLPGVGKSSLAKDLGRRFRLPVFMKDAFKEAMIESAAATDPADLQLMGRLSFATIPVIFEAMAAAQQPAIYEGNFNGDIFSPQLESIVERYPIQLINAHLICAREILVQRFEERERSGQRHPAHQGLADLDRVRQALLNGPDPKIQIKGCQQFEFDTYEFSKTNFEPLYQAIKIALEL